MIKGAETDAVLLQQHNVRQHTSAATTDTTACLGFTMLLHPVYGPDVAPSDFHLFPKLKEDLRGQNFSSNKEVKDAVCQWFQEKQKGFFTHEIQKLVQHWQKNIEVGGHYVEEW